MAKENHYSKLTGTMPKEDIICKDCVYRDRAVIELEDKVIRVGVTKGFCEMYQGPPDNNGKPSEILFNDANCDYYAKEY